MDVFSGAGYYLAHRDRFVGEQRMESGNNGLGLGPNHGEIRGVLPMRRGPVTETLCPFLTICKERTVSRVRLKKYRDSLIGPRW